MLAVSSRYITDIGLIDWPAYVLLRESLLPVCCSRGSLR